MVLGLREDDRLLGLDPPADQQVAGVIMWISAGGIYLAAALVLLVTWIRATEREDVML